MLPSRRYTGLLASAFLAASCVASRPLPAAAATISLLALPSVSARQPWATGIQGEADLPGLGGYDVRAVARAVASLTGSFNLATPGAPTSSIDSSFHFWQVAVTFSRTYPGHFALYAGGGYAWERSEDTTANVAGSGLPASGATSANGPTVEAGIRLPIGTVAQVEAGVMVLLAGPEGQICTAAGACAAPDTRSTLTYPYVAVGVHI